MALKTKMTGTTWNKEYYEILEYFFWEPQHLGKQKNLKSRYSNLKEVLNHLRKLEVTLNHQFNLFFNLLPRQLLLELFQDFFGKDFDEDFVFDSQATRTLVSSYGTVTQPDLLFIGSRSLVGIEMKVSARSDHHQLMKYCLLALLENEKVATKRDFNLLFLGTGEFSNLFKEKYLDIAALKAAFEQFDIPVISRKGGIDLGRFRDQIYELVRDSSIAYLSYKDFHNLLEAKRRRLDTSEPGSEVIAKLIDGIMDELEVRQLSEGR